MTDAPSEQLLALAARVEAAKAGEQRELLIVAFSLIFPDHYMEGRSGIGPSRWSTFKQMIDPGAYESAAMQLVPEGWRKSYDDLDDGRCGWRFERDNEQIYSNAATPALALTAAALRAHASGEQG